ncbi:MAG: hypothetical protein ACFB9N_06845 [Geitlerinemataceae cyanobacterium]
MNSADPVAGTLKFFKKAGAGVLLAVGAPIVLLAGYGLLDPSSTVRQLSIVIMAIGLPPTGIAGWLVWSLMRQNKRDAIEAGLASQQKLQATLFRLLKQNDGRVSLLQFAMEADLPGDTAKDYLKNQAKVFEADVEVSTGGNPIYCFEVQPELFQLEESIATDWES